MLILRTQRRRRVTSPYFCLRYLNDMIKWIREMKRDRIACERSGIGRYLGLLIEFSMLGLLLKMIQGCFKDDIRMYKRCFEDVQKMI